MINKRDVAVSLIISIGSLGIAIGVIGIRNSFIIILFFIIPLVLSLAVFLIFKPRTSKSFFDKRWDY